MIRMIFSGSTGLNSENTAIPMGCRLSLWHGTGVHNTVVFVLASKSVSDRDIWLAAWRHPNQTRIAVNLSLKLTRSRSEDDFDALGTFNALEQKKEVIEDDFGGPLEWQKEPNFPSLGPVIGVYENITPDRDDWQRQFEWIFTMLETLNQVFQAVCSYLMYYTATGNSGHSLKMIVLQ